MKKTKRSAIILAAIIGAGGLTINTFIDIKNEENITRNESSQDIRTLFYFDF